MSIVSCWLACCIMCIQMDNAIASDHGSFMETSCLCFLISTLEVFNSEIEGFFTLFLLI